MIRLILMRHAKSSWKSEAPTDHARPLNKRGRRDAPRMAEALVSRGWWPVQVLSSDSVRTRETWCLMERAVDQDCEAQFISDLYLGDREEIREQLIRIEPGPEPILLLGHNPGWEETASWMTGLDVQMTTANCALLATEARSWSAALDKPGQWSLIEHLRPRDLDESE